MLGFRGDGRTGFDEVERVEVSLVCSVLNPLLVFVHLIIFIYDKERLVIG